MTDDWLLASGHASALLAEGSAFRRLPRGPRRPRPREFVLNKFETRALVYDAFWHVDGRRALLVGPPPLNLWPQLRHARYFALPGRQPLSPSYYLSTSVMLTELPAMPPDATGILMEVAGEQFELPLQPNLGAELAGRRVLFTMSKDNDLAWIREWAHYHAVMQGADAIVLFDNGSTRYAPADIAAALRRVRGIRHAAVMSLPYRYGATDLAVLSNPYYGLFLQIASMSIALRRYAPRAAGLLNCDIDELTATPPGTSVFDLAERSPHGLVVMRGQFIEPVPANRSRAGPFTHRDYLSRRRDPLLRLSRPRKWALDPSRPWVASLAVHPYMHWIEGRPWFGKTEPPGMFYWHFRGINTNWKERRTDASHLLPAELETDERFAAIVASPAFLAD